MEKAADPIGAQVRARRGELGLNQTELAELSGTSTRWIRELEQGKESVQLDTLQRALAALGLVLTVEIRPAQGLA